MSDPSSAPRASWLGALVAVLLVGLGVWEIAAIRRARAAPDEDWRAAAAVVRAGYRAGDLIVFAPEWVDPIGRLHLGDLIPIDVAARMDSARFARIWELSTRGQAHPDVAALTARSSQTFGEVTVRLYEQAPATVLVDVRDRLKTARVDGPAARGPSLELAEVGFAPRRCIQVVPNPGKAVRLTFPGLPAGTLVGYVGLADVFTRRDIRRPGRLIVETGDRALVEVAPGVDDGWVRFETPVPGGDVTFVASADAPQRLICFAAEVRR